MNKADKSDFHPKELERAFVFLLEALADILAAGGASFQTAQADLKKLAASAKVLHPETVKRSAFNLAKDVDEIKRRVAAGLVEIRGEVTPASPVAGAGRLEEILSAGLAPVVEAIGALRPEAAHQLRARELLRQLHRGLDLEKFFPDLAAFALQVREDLWTEKTRALGRIGEILKELEETEKYFADSVAESQASLEKSEMGFTAAMDDGLRTLEALADSKSAELEELCRRLAEKVNHLHTQVQIKRQIDQVRFESLDLERRMAEKRLEKTRRDYDDFNAQSHEMLMEIEKLRTISMHDPLTGLYNRRAYDNQITSTIAAVAARELKTASLVVFDVDHFRVFNNAYGHLAGDRVLIHVARMTAKTLRGDDLFFRYGGDEFAIIMPNAVLKTASGVAEKVRVALEAVEFKIFKNSDQIAKVTVSMGVAEIDRHDDPGRIFNRADQALYESKKAGRNRVAVKSAQG